MKKDNKSPFPFLFWVQSIMKFIISIISHEGNSYSVIKRKMYENCK